MSISSLQSAGSCQPVYGLEDLRVLELIDRPAWVFDMDAMRICWANDALVKAWGAPSLQALKERDLSQISDGLRRRFAVLRDRLAAGERVTERVIIYPDGRPLTLDTNKVAFPLPNGHFGVLLVSDLIDTERLDGMTMRGLEVFRHMSSMVTLYDVDGTVVCQNPAGDRAFGHGGRSVSLRGRFVKPAELDDLRAAVEADGWGRMEALTRTAQGEAWHIVELRSAPDPATGRPSLLEIREDVTQRRVAQEELRAAKELAEAADRAKSAFLANMSHELRTPLNAIIGYGELLLEEAEGGELPPWYGQDLERILRAGNHLLGLINNVLDLSKIEAGQMELFVQECRIERLVDDVIATIRPLAEAGRNQLITEVAADLRPMMVDETRLRQILVNLLGNACKFTREGEIRLTVAQGGGQVEFAVADTGVGMSPDDLKRIFHPFAQSDASVSARFGGTGLGLTISRNFCEMMGGTIDVTSELGAGSTFTVALPLRCVA